MHTNETISESVAALTHPSLPPWTVSTGSHHRWRWRLWWTLSHTVSPHSPSVRSVCSSHQHSHSCTCCRHTPQPRRESVSRALLTCPEIKLPGLRCTGGSQLGSGLMCAADPARFLVSLSGICSCRLSNWESCFYQSALCSFLLRSLGVDLI